MPQRIIYKQDNSVLAIITPSPEALSYMTIEEIAAKDVPTGKPYKIVDTVEIPTDRSKRNLWTVDNTELIDGVGA